MKELVPYIVVVWVIAMIGAFPFFSRPRQAVLFIVISGTLFLPEAFRNRVQLGPLHFSKFHSISYAALFGTLLFNSGRLFSLRVTGFDLPAILWCLSPFPSVLTNAPPPDGSPMLRDAMSQTWAQIVSYGVPYLLGRIYFTSQSSFRQLGLGMITWALIYVPLCLYEIRMSPQLHAMVYGYHQHAFAQTVRFDGYRPMVFMTHGLTLALFMLSATVFACFMWWGGEFHRPKSQSLFTNALRFSPGVLGVIVVLLKSTNALALGLIGAIAFATAWLTRSRWILILLAIVPIVYVTVRMTGVWTGESLVRFVATNLDQGRAQSLEFRLTNETMLVEKALHRYWFGWGGWARSFVINEQTGKEMSVPDGLWIIALGDRGVIGLIGLGGLALLPVVRFAFLFPPSKSFQWAAPTAGAYVLVLATIDSLPNVGLASPIYLIIAGALTGLQPDPIPNPAWAESARLEPG